MLDFRKHQLGNTCTKTYKNYRDYKDPWLINDFGNRCGYCNGHDSWAGGRRGMQIDHFAPKKKFPLLKNVYTNLVYSCFYCNNHKSDDWVTASDRQPISGDKLTGYIHPRDNAYVAAFKRDFSGEIIPLNDVAKYMFKKMCLGLKRHQLIFILEELLEIWQELNTLVVDPKLDNTKRNVLENRKSQVSNKFMEYILIYRKVAA